VNVIIAYPDRAIIDVSVQELMTIEAALLGFHRDQQNAQTPFGIRIQDTARDARRIQDECWKQDARARGLTVEGDEPVVEGGAF